MQIKLFHIRLQKEYLNEDQENINRFLESVVVKKTSSELITGAINFWSIIVFYEEYEEMNASKGSSKGNIVTTVEDELTDQEHHVFLALKEWRRDKADELGLPAFMICHNSELMSLAKAKPMTIEALSKIKGFGGGQKIAKFGEDLIGFFSSI